MILLFISRSKIDKYVKTGKKVSIRQLKCAKSVNQGITQWSPMTKVVISKASTHIHFHTRKINRIIHPRRNVTVKT